MVESHKDQIFDEIIRVSNALGARSEMLAALERAKKEVQFTTALEQVQDALPESLLINGQNPLKLLHAALSGGLHGKSDEECLELAHAVRVVLIELAEKLSNALKEEIELSDAVVRLMKARSQ